MFFFLSTKIGKVITSEEYQLVVWHDHYEKLVFSLSGDNFNMDYWNENPLNKRLFTRNHTKWIINYEISIDEIKADIIATSDYKSSGPDSINFTAGVHNAKLFTSIYSFSKYLKIYPLSEKCALVQASYVQCSEGSTKKRKTSILKKK
ncbi:hypothetical protein PIROE2DRAFT_2542 [Piromyces sp. E2]|nr:hypothetical protein PIROE2DRAFT_2542 [Piromyces sp. E2]|eukprot:OUM69456.1 hypothetical protein PIROE2DRAFT_2542 [Piromyces sp. E2]